MGNNKGANINVGNIPFKLFYREAVLSKWKVNIEFWMFLIRHNHLYVSIEMS